MQEFVEMLIAKLEEERDYANEYYSKDMSRYVAYQHAIEIVNQLAEEYNNGWILCEERLPEDGQEVLIWYEDGHSKGREIATFQRGKTKEELCAMPLLCYSFEDQFGNNLKPYAWFGHGPMQWFGQDVLAWQPLPAPYKEVE